jgi:hypothetical protein
MPMQNHLYYDVYGVSKDKNIIKYKSMDIKNDLMRRAASFKR